MNDLSDKGISGALKDGQTLFSFLGKFWHNVYEDPDFIKRFCLAIGLLSTQLELKKNEAKSASGRKLIPAYSRERWLCIHLSPETRDVGDASKIELSDSAPKISNASYNFPKIGTGGRIDGKVFYSLPRYVISAESAHERVYDPEITLTFNDDFGIEDDSIFFDKNKDPFSDSRFKKSQDGADTVIWLKNALVDRNYVFDYIGYVVKMYVNSSKHSLDIVNAFWDILNTGATISNLTYFVCKVLDVPCIENESETIKSVLDGKITTDYNSYECKGGDIAVFRGHSYSRGTPLTKSIIFNDKPEKISGSSNVLFLKKEFFASGAISGLGFSSDPSPIIFCGWIDEDTKLLPKLKFNVYGSPGAADLFFNSCWQRCGESRTDMSKLLDVQLPANPSIGADVSDPNKPFCPIQFMLDNLIGTNIAMIDIDLSSLTETGLSGINFLSRVFEVLPPGICLMFRMFPEDINEQYNCNSIADDVRVAVTPVVTGSGSCVDETVPDSSVSDDIQVFMVPTKEANEI